MKNLRFLSGLLFLVCISYSQEPALRISVKDPTFRIEYGTTVASLNDVFGQSYLDFSIWGGAGATIDAGNHLSGSFSALWKTPNFAKGVDLHLGMEYRSIEGYKPDWDFVLHFTLSPTQTVAINQNKLIYIQRF